MDDVRTPIYAAEPYQESQGRDSPNASSPDALVAFYKDMEQKEIVERKLSKRKSNSIWSRKSVKRSTALAAPPAQKHQPQLDLPSEEKDERTRGEEEREMEKLEEQKDTVPRALDAPRSIIPDTAKDLPDWYNKEAWSSPLPAFKLKYNLHNPVGPRWYKNHHLIPPSHIRPATRPPSVFSPSFPPMASSTLQDRSEDSTRLPGPSRTPSNSPLPTPNSSQTRVEDSGARPRSRKSSQTAHDNVDLLDVTDPWGTNWHHHSPYDIGLSNGSISVDQNASQIRTRRSSITVAQSRKKTVIPSPLSQSTSAVHLHNLDVITQMPRKLSKRRVPALANIFGGQTQQPDRNAVSLPVTPVEHIPVPSDSPSSSIPPKRLSATPAEPLLLHNDTSSKKEKRGSILGRIVKKFSILRKPTADQWRSSRDDWQCVSTDDAAANLARQHLVTGRQLSPEKDPSDLTRRIPPPSLADPSPVGDSEIVPEADRSSSISVETPFPIGRLTIANPDVLSDDTPTQGALPLLPEKSEIRDRGRHSLQNSTNDSGPVDANLHVPVTAPRRTSISSVILPPEAKSPVVPDKTSPASLPPISGSREMGSEAPVIPMSTNSLGPPLTDMLLTAPAQISKDVATNSIRSYVNQSSIGDAHSSEIRTKAHSPSIVDLPLKPAGPHPSDRPLYSPPLPSPPSTSPSFSAPLPSKDAAHPRSRSTDSFAPYDYSPLSASSMLANPPTPHNADISMPPSPEPLPPPLPPTTSQDRKRSSREPSPTSNMVRQTETFKLVRSSSNHIFASSETIVAGGQQWEVVESLENKLKGRIPSKSNDRESGSRRDQRREGRHASDISAETEERNQVRSHRSRKSPPTEHARSNSSKPVVDNAKERPGKSVRKKEDGNRPSDRKRSPSNLDVNKPQPPPPPSTPGAPPARQLERQTSTSARPTSELPSAAEMNALRAKEAWDMERLWKARSVYGHDSREFTTSTVPLTVKDEKDAQNAMHGSSHTAFVVQSPFQSQPPHIYHSMPTIPSPIVYSSSIPTSSQPFPSTQQYSSKHLLPNSDQKTASASRLPLTNPLPEPPRASSYEPAPLSF